MKQSTVVRFAQRVCIFTSLALLVSCGSNNSGSGSGNQAAPAPIIASQSQPTSGASPSGSAAPTPAGVIVAGDQQAIVLNDLAAQLALQIDLNHKESETVYESRDFPDVCTRTVQTGTRSDCHMENERRCRNEMENVCHNEPIEACRNVEERVCTDRARTQCHTETRRVCTRTDHPVCRQERIERCENFPRQICVNVPIYGQEQYSCTQTRRVAVGERLTLRQLAHVRIEMRNTRNQNLGTDTALAFLDRGVVKIQIQGNPQVQYQITEISQSVQRLSDIDQVIQASFTIEAL